MILHNPEQRSIRLISSANIILWMVGVIVSAAWLWMVNIWGLAGIIVAGALCLLFIAESTLVKAMPDGTVRVSYLIGTPITLQNPRMNARYWFRSYEIVLVSPSESLPLASRKHGTLSGNAKLGLRFARTLGLELHPSLEASLNG